MPVPRAIERSLISIWSSKLYFLKQSKTFSKPSDWTILIETILRDCINASRNLIGPKNSPELFLGLHIPSNFLSSKIIGPSIKIDDGFNSFSKAHPYIKGLMLEPGKSLELPALSNFDFSKSNPPT